MRTLSIVIIRRWNIQWRNAVHFLRTQMSGVLINYQRRQLINTRENDNGVEIQSPWYTGEQHRSLSIEEDGVGESSTAGVLAGKRPIPAFRDKGEISWCPWKPNCAKDPKESSPFP